VESLNVALPTLVAKGGLLFTAYLVAAVSGTYVLGHLSWGPAGRSEKARYKKWPERATFEMTFPSHMGKKKGRVPGKGGDFVKGASGVRPAGVLGELVLGKTAGGGWGGEEVR